MDIRFGLVIGATWLIAAGGGCGSGDDGADGVDDDGSESGVDDPVAQEMYDLCRSNILALYDQGCRSDTVDDHCAKDAQLAEKSGCAEKARGYQQCLSIQLCLAFEPEVCAFEVEESIACEEAYCAAHADEPLCD